MLQHQEYLQHGMEAEHAEQQIAQLLEQIDRYDCDSVQRRY